MRFFMSFLVLQKFDQDPGDDPSGGFYDVAGGVFLRLNESAMNDRLVLVDDFHEFSLQGLALDGSVSAVHILVIVVRHGHVLSSGQIVKFGARHEAVVREILSDDRRRVKTRKIGHGDRFVIQTHFRLQPRSHLRGPPWSSRHHPLRDRTSAGL